MNWCRVMPGAITGPPSSPSSSTAMIPVVAARNATTSWCTVAVIAARSRSPARAGADGEPPVFGRVRDALESPRDRRRIGASEVISRANSGGLNGGDLSGCA